jgi:hypothetical protein
MESIHCNGYTVGLIHVEVVPVAYLAYLGCSRLPVPVCQRDCQRLAVLLSLPKTPNTANGTFRLRAISSEGWVVVETREMTTRTCRLLKHPLHLVPSSPSPTN